MLISALTRGGEGGHLFRLNCSVVLWGGTPQTDSAGVCGACAQCGPPRVFPSSRRRVLPGSTLLGPPVLFSGAVPGGPLGLTPFPGLSSSGAQVFGARTVPGAGGASASPPRPGCSVSRVRRESTVSGVPRSPPGS